MMKKICLLALFLLCAASAYAAQELKQSAQAVVRLGPFVSSSNGVTPVTGITLAAADQAEVLKSGGGATVGISGNTWAAVAGADGWYDLTLTASDTDTPGELVVVVQDASACLPVHARFSVLAPIFYEAKYGSGAVNATVVANNDKTGYSLAANQDVRNVTGSVTGSVGSVAGNVGGNVTGSVGSVVSGVTVSTNNDKTGYSLAPDQDIRNVTGNVTGSVGSVVSGVTVSTNNDKTGYSLATPPPSASEISGAVWNRPRSGHTAAGTFGEGISSVQGPVTGSVGGVTAPVALTAAYDAAKSAAQAGDRMDLIDSPNSAAATALAASLWGLATTANNVAGSYGELIELRLDAQVSSRAAAADVPSTAAIDAALSASHGAGSWEDAGVSSDVNVVSVGGVLVAGPGDLRADVSGLATSADIAGLNNLSAADVWAFAGTGGRTLTSGAGMGIPTTVQIRQEMDANSTRLASIETGINGLPAAVRSEIDTGSTRLLAIVADTDELQRAWTTGGRLDLVLEEARESASAVKTDLINGGRLDLILDAILEDTGTTIPALIAGLNNPSAQAIWNYGIENGFTAAELLRLGAGMMAGAQSVSGNLIYVKSLDGSKDRIIFGRDGAGGRTVVSRDAGE